MVPQPSSSSSAEFPIAPSLLSPSFSSCPFLHPLKPLSTPSPLIQTLLSSLSLSPSSSSSAPSALPSYSSSPLVLCSSPSLSPHLLAYCITDIIANVIDSKTIDTKEERREMLEICIKRVEEEIEQRRKEEKEGERYNFKKRERRKGESENEMEARECSHCNSQLWIDRYLALFTHPPSSTGSSHSLSTTPSSSFPATASLSSSLLDYDLLLLSVVWSSFVSSPSFSFSSISTPFLPLLLRHVLKRSQSNQQLYTQQVISYINKQMKELSVDNNRTNEKEKQIRINHVDTVLQSVMLSVKGRRKGNEDDEKEICKKSRKALIQQLLMHTYNRVLKKQTMSTSEVQIIAMFVEKILVFCISSACCTTSSSHPSASPSVSSPSSSIDSNSPIHRVLLLLFSHPNSLLPSSLLLLSRTLLQDFIQVASIQLEEAVRAAVRRSEELKVRVGKRRRYPMRWFEMMMSEEVKLQTSLRSTVVPAPVSRPSSSTLASPGSPSFPPLNYIHPRISLPLNRSLLKRLCANDREVIGATAPSSSSSTSFTSSPSRFQSDDSIDWSFYCSLISSGSTFVQVSSRYNLSFGSLWRRYQLYKQFKGFLPSVEILTEFGSTKCKQHRKMRKFCSMQCKNRSKQQQEQEQKVVENIIQEMKRSQEESKTKSVMLPISSSSSSSSRSSSPSSVPSPLSTSSPRSVSSTASSSSAFLFPVSATPISTSITPPPPTADSHSFSEASSSSDSFWVRLGHLLSLGFSIDFIAESLHINSNLLQKEYELKLHCDQTFPTIALQKESIAAHGRNDQEDRNVCRTQSIDKTHEFDLATDKINSNLASTSSHSFTKSLPCNSDTSRKTPLASYSTLLPPPSTPSLSSVSTPAITPTSTTDLTKGWIKKRVRGIKSSDANHFEEQREKKEESETELEIKRKKSKENLTTEEISVANERKSSQISVSRVAGGVRVIRESKRMRGSENQEDELVNASGSGDSSDENSEIGSGNDDDSADARDKSESQDAFSLQSLSSVISRPQSSKLLFQ